MVNCIFYKLFLKNLDDFYVRSNGRVENRCKFCIKEINRIRKEEIKEYKKKYYSENKELIKAKLGNLSEEKKEIITKNITKEISTDIESIMSPIKKNLEKIEGIIIKLEWKLMLLNLQPLCSKINRDLKRSIIII